MGVVKKIRKGIGKVASAVGGVASKVPGIGGAVGSALKIGGGLLGGSLASKLPGGPSEASPSEYGYVSPYTSEYENAARSRLLNRAANGPISSAEATKDYAPELARMAGYEAGIAKPSLFKGPAKLSFASLPDAYKEGVYESGAGSIRREGAGGLERLKETVGVRRPGLLAKVGMKQEQSILEKLAGLRREAELEAMRQKVQLGKEEQLSQADEDYRAADFERKGSQAASDEAARQITARSAITGQERSAQDDITDRLSDMFAKTSGMYSTAARGAADVSEDRRKRASDAYSKAFEGLGGFLSDRVRRRA